MKVGDLVTYHRNAFDREDRVGMIVALRPITPKAAFDHPFWAEVRYTDNPHQEVTCKVANLKVVSQ